MEMVTRREGGGCGSEQAERARAGAWARAMGKASAIVPGPPSSD